LRSGDSVAFEKSQSQTSSAVGKVSTELANIYQSVKIISAVSIDSIKHNSNKAMETLNLHSKEMEEDVINKLQLFEPFLPKYFPSYLKSLCSTALQLTGVDKLHEYLQWWYSSQRSSEYEVKEASLVGALMDLIHMNVFLSVFKLKLVPFQNSTGVQTQTKPTARNFELGPIIESEIQTDVDSLLDGSLDDREHFFKDWQNESLSQLVEDMVDIIKTDEDVYDKYMKIKMLTNTYIDDGNFRRSPQFSLKDLEMPENM